MVGVASQTARFASSLRDPMIVSLQLSASAMSQTNDWAMLWDIAAERAEKDSKTPEWHWLRLMDAIWRGELGQNGIQYTWRRRDSKASVENVTLTREELAEAALGFRGAPPDSLIGWTMNHYDEVRAPYEEYFKCDLEGRCGLAVRREEYDSWNASRGGELNTSVCDSSFSDPPWVVAIPKIREFRKKRIRRFAERQRRTREWINFAEIADWCARENGSIKPDEERRSIAYAMLGASLRAGEFERSGRTRVLFLSPSTSMAKITRETFETIVAANDDEILVSAYLAHCWVPRDICREWFGRQRLPWPLVFDPVSGEEVADQAPKVPSAVSVPKTTIGRKRGRKPYVLKRVMLQMRDDIKHGRSTLAQLQDTLEKNLAANYGASRDTVRKARSAVVSEFVGKLFSDK
jgi:hypothetical protein